MVERHEMSELHEAVVWMWSLIAAKEALEEANLFVTAANDTQNVIPMKKKTRGKNS